MTWKRTIVVRRPARRMIVVALALLGTSVATAQGDAFEGYRLVQEFDLPGGGGPLDALADGRIIAVIYDEVYVEGAAGSRTFSLQGSLPSADISPYGAAFVRVSPDGTRIAVGNNGGSDSYSNYQIGIFDVGSLTCNWFDTPHYDAEWIDDQYLAVTTFGESGPNIVTALDTYSADPANPDNPVIIENIGGASGGIAFDQARNLYTGNGYASTGPSGTGATKAFEYSAWIAPLSGGPAPDFETDGTLVVDILSASPLALDNDGNLIVGGVDFVEPVEINFVAIVHSQAVSEALAGMGPANPQNPAEVLRIDPDEQSGSNIYSIYYNESRSELYLRSYGSSRIYVYLDLTAVPAVSTWGMVILALLLLTAGTFAVSRAHLRARALSPVNGLSAGMSAKPGAFRRAKIIQVVCAFLIIGGLVPPLSNATPFAVSVIDYSPAPGQFVNHASFNDPDQALGPPAGAGTSVANNVSVVTLGGFGGSITLAFDHTVLDEPLNPFGMDAIVFGNAFWVGGDPSAHWAECGVIEICRDLNDNGRPDDDEPWRLIPGSHIDDPFERWEQQTWDDDVTDDTYPPPFSIWIPVGYAGTWATESYALPYEVFGEESVIRNPSSDQSIEGIHGYADYAPTLVLGDTNGDNVVDDPDLTAEEFYTVADNPHEAGMTEAAGGGDAFDIAWAIDPETGEPAQLDGFDFIRITTAVNAIGVQILNEKSVEIDAVADVAPDPFGDYDGDGDIDLSDIGGVQLCFDESGIADPLCTRLDRQPDGLVNDSDVAAFVERITGPH